MPDGPSIAPVGILDRPGQAFQAVSMGDLDAGWRSMLSPESLTIGERDQLLRKWGIRRDSLQGRVMETLTNPAVMASIALTFVSPIPSAKALFKVKSQIDGMLARVPVLRSLAGARSAFRGTPVPDLLDDIVLAKNEIHTTYMEGMLGPAFEKYARATGKTPNAREQVMAFLYGEKLHLKSPHGWKDVGPLVPQLDKAMTPALRQLSDDVGAALEHTQANVFNKPEFIKGLRDTAKRLEGLGYDVSDMKAMQTWLKGGKWKGIPDYRPHRTIRTQADAKRLHDAITATANGQEFSRKAQLQTVTFLGREFYRREGAMMPALQELGLLGDLVDPAALTRLQNGVKDKLLTGFGKAGMSDRTLRTFRRKTLDEITAQGKNLVADGERDMFVTGLAEHMPKQYSLRLEPVLQNYYHSIGNTYAWSIRGNGPKMLGELQRAKLLGKVDARSGWRARMLENTVIPSALGRPTPRQALNAQLWDQRWGQVIGLLESPRVRAAVGDDFSNHMRDMYSSSMGAFSLRGFSHSVASYFYLSTLGLNPSAAFKNTFQQVLTTAPLVGGKNALAGQLEVLKRMPQYFEMRLAQKIGHADALKRVFPEFVESGLHGSPLTDEVLGRAMESAYRLQKTAPIGVSTVEKAKRAAMSVFKLSETNVRMSGFYAGLTHAKAGGMRGGAAIKHAHQVAVRTQFVPGLTDTPMAFLPAGTFGQPVVRQLAMFPTKFTEFTLEGFRRAIQERDFSQLSRQVMYSWATMEVGQTLGVNMKDALIGGALPSFTNVDDRGSILAPLPIVPPAATVVGGFLSAAGSGDWDQFTRQMPLLVPGGVAAARALGLVPGINEGVGQPAARWLNRKHADYAGRDPHTGRIPVYTGKGSLVGYYKPWELVRHSLGIKGGAIDQEAELANRLRLDSNAIKDTRRLYLDALFANDATKASNIGAEHERRFGHPIALTTDQLKQMQRRRKMTRIEKQLSALPRDVRPFYEAAAFQGPVGRAVRSGTYKPVAAELPTYTNELDPMSEVDIYSIGRQRTRVPTTFP